MDVVRLNPSKIDLGCDEGALLATAVEWRHSLDFSGAAVFAHLIIDRILVMNHGSLWVGVSSRT